MCACVYAMSYRHRHRHRHHRLRALRSCTHMRHRQMRLRWIYSLCSNFLKGWGTKVQRTTYISVFVPSSVGGFEKAGPSRLPCVFVAVLRCAHTLTCIIRGLHFHMDNFSHYFCTTIFECTTNTWIIFHR